MDTPRRWRPAAFLAPMMIGLIAAQRAAEHVRTVDFLLLFAGGAAFGTGLAGLVRAYRARRGQTA